MNDTEKELKNAYSNWFMDKYADEGLCNGDMCIQFEESHNEQILEDIGEVLGLL